MEEKRWLDIFLQLNMIKLIIWAEGAETGLSFSSEGNGCTRHVAPFRHTQSKVNKTMWELSGFNLFYKLLYLHRKKQLGKQFIYFSNSFSPVTSTVSL